MYKTNLEDVLTLKRKKTSTDFFLEKSVPHSKRHVALLFHFCINLLERNVLMDHVLWE